MKQIVIFFFVFCLSFNYLFSQEKTTRDYTFDQDVDIPNYDLYFGGCSGINYFTGLIGPSIEVRTIKNLTINGGLGLGGWGYKASGGLRYYLKYPAGISFNLGYSWASGIDGFEYELELQNGQTEELRINLLEASVVNLSIAYHWRIKRRLRINLETGYSVATSTEAYEIVDNVVLSDVSKMVLRIMQPGGLMIGFGFSVGF